VDRRVGCDFVCVCVCQSVRAMGGKLLGLSTPKSVCTDPEIKRSAVRRDGDERLHVATTADVFSLYGP